MIFTCVFFYFFYFSRFNFLLLSLFFALVFMAAWRRFLVFLAFHVSFFFSSGMEMEWKERGCVWEVTEDLVGLDFVGGFYFFFFFFSFFFTFYFSFFTYLCAGHFERISFSFFNLYCLVFLSFFLILFFTF